MQTPDLRRLKLFQKAQKAIGPLKAKTPYGVVNEETLAVAMREDPDEVKRMPEIGQLVQHERRTLEDAHILNRLASHLHSGAHTWRELMEVTGYKIRSPLDQRIAASLEVEQAVRQFLRGGPPPRSQAPPAPALAAPGSTADAGSAGPAAPDAKGHPAGRSLRRHGEMHRFFGVLLAAGTAVGAALAQEKKPEPTLTPRDPQSVSETIGKAKQTTREDIEKAIGKVEDLTVKLQTGYARYRADLKKVMETYDKAYGGEPGADQDIEGDDPDQIREMKEMLFATRMVAAGVAYDPNLTLEIEQLRTLIDKFETAIKEATHTLALGTHSIALGDLEPISPAEYKSLWARLRKARRQAEDERNSVEAGLPIKLIPFTQYIIKLEQIGLNPVIRLFGLELGNPLGNVTSLSTLTYYGLDPVTGLHQFIQEQWRFRLTTKTTFDTFYKAKRIAIDPDPAHPKFGYHLRTRRYPERRYFNQRIHHVFPNRRDFIWKISAALGTPEPTLETMAQAIQRVHDARLEVDSAIKAFKELSRMALSKNDQELKARFRADPQLKRLGLPDQDIILDTDARARLYAARALAVKDPLFVDANNRLKIARQKTAKAEKEAENPLAYFNATPEDALPIPWQDINRMQDRFLTEMDRVKECDARADDITPPDLTEGQTVLMISRLGLPPNVIVTLKNLGAAKYEDGAREFVEDLWYSVPPAIKGIDRYRRAPIIVLAHPDGTHEVIGSLGSTYFTGPGRLESIYKLQMQEEDSSASNQFLPAPLPPSSNFLQAASPSVPVVSTPKPATKITKEEIYHAVEALDDVELKEKIEETSQAFHQAVDRLLAQAGQSQDPLDHFDSNLPRDIQSTLMTLRLWTWGADPNDAELIKIMTSARDLYKEAQTRLDRAREAMLNRSIVDAKTKSPLSDAEWKDLGKTYARLSSQLEARLGLFSPTTLHEGEWQTAIETKQYRVFQL